MILLIKTVPKDLTDAARKLEDRIVYHDPDWYSTFPCIARAGNGDLIVTFRRAPVEPEGHAAAQHLHSRSRAVLVRSSDEGHTWTRRPTEICPDDELGQQDPGIARTSTGRLAANFFRWQAHSESEESSLAKNGCFLRAKGALWTNAGVGVVTSDDDGHTWSPLTRIAPGESGASRARIIEPTPGLLLLPCYRPCSRSSTRGFEAYVMASEDDGRTWRFHGTIARSGASELQVHAYHEPFIVCTAGRRLACFMRCYVDNGLMEYATSDDLGRTWSPPVVSKAWGYPQCAIRLRDDRIFLAYGYRREPRGVRCRVLDPDCSNLDNARELILRDDGVNSDLGYPNAIELDGGRVLVVYYFHDAGQVRHIACSIVSV